MGNDAATASGLGQVRGEIALRDTAQWRGTWIAIPADFGTAPRCPGCRGVVLPGAEGGVPACVKAGWLEACLDECPHPAPSVTRARTAKPARIGDEGAIWCHGRAPNRWRRRRCAVTVETGPRWLAFRRSHS